MNTIVGPAPIGVGLSSTRAGMRLARAPDLRRYVWLPALTSLVVIVGLLTVAFGYVRDAIDWILSLVPQWLSFIEFVLAPLFYLIGIAAGGWLFGFIAVLVASPFLGALSASAERAEFGDGPTLDEAMLPSLLSALRRELRKLVYYLPRLLIVFGVSLIPMVSPIAPAIWFLFAAWMMAIQFVDYAAENRGLEFRATIAALKANRAATLGFGAITAMLLAVPLVNVLFIPAAVCGGAVLWRRLSD